MRAVAVLGICFAVGCSSSGSRTNAMDDVGFIVKPVEDTYVANDVTDNPVATLDIQQPVDVGSTDTRASNDTGVLQPREPIAEAPPYDFVAAAPWYACAGGAFPAEAVVVDGFVQEYQYFGNENRREVDIEVDFPAPGSWSQVGLLFRLECPESGLCDHWDRTGSVSLVLEESEEGNQEQVEIARHITPYKIEMCQYIDITGMAPLLTGKRTLRSWIDTWVGPGHAQGEGWRVTTQFVFYPGKPKAPDEVVNIWGRRQITVGEIEPDANVDSQIDPKNFMIPADATRVVAHLTTTGHSFGNHLNCAEFCQMNQELYINGVKYTVNPWRDDCPQNPVSPQYGTWEFPRNGWCPGAIATGTNLEVTDAIKAGENNVIDFDIRLANGTEYDNISPVDLLPSEYVSLKLYVWR